MFSIIVRLLRESIGVSQGDLADAVGLSQSYVNKIECGKCAPRPLTAAAVLRVLRRMAGPEAKAALREALALLEREDD